MGLRSTAAVTAIAACAIVGACAPQTQSSDVSAGFAELTVAPATVRAGGNVELRLTNRSAHSLGYNLCTSALERSQGDGWGEGVPLNEACTMELRTLAPGASAAFSGTLPAAVPPGIWRVRSRIEWPLGQDMVGVASEPFEVTR
jgi:hypothetical protein